MPLNSSSFQWPTRSGPTKMLSLAGLAIAALFVNTTSKVSMAASVSSIVAMPLATLTVSAPPTVP